MLKFEKNPNALAAEVNLGDVMDLIPWNQFVIVFYQWTGMENGYREEDAIFDGQVSDWYDETMDAQEQYLRRRQGEMVVVGVQPVELESVVGPVIMIVVE